MENEEMQIPEVTVDAVEQNENNPVAETAAPERKARPQVEVTDEMIEKSSKTLSTMLDFLGLDGTVKAEKRPSKINLIISSEDAGRIIGRKGQSLESRGGERRSNGGSRRFEDNDKDDILQQQALDAAKEVRRWGEPVTLPAMNSHDRRIIHITLENDADLQTESIGEGSVKSVVVSLKK